MRVHLNIGSNMGDRVALIGRAIARLASRFPPGLMLLSDYVESAPWGYESESAFLNRGALLLTADSISPFEVLEITQSVEREIGHGAPHRKGDGTYCDRPIDIDIIDIDGIKLSTPRLTLPHPRAALRSFVAGPVEQLEALAASRKL